MIRKVQPYENFKIDDKVLVRDIGEEHWRKRYFAGTDEDGKPITFIGGRTSFTGADDEATVWDECIAYNPEIKNVLPH